MRMKREGRRRIRSVLAFAAALAPAACSSGAIAALVLTLNGGHKKHHSSSSSDDGAGNQVIVATDLRFDGQSELFSVPIDGAFQDLLSGPTVRGGTTRRFALSPDRTRVAFLASKDVAGVDELYVVDLRAPSDPIKLHPDLGRGDGVRDFRWAPDSSRVAYAAIQSHSGSVQLFTTFADGSGNVSLLPGSAGAVAFPDSEEFNGTVAAFEWSPDSTYVACATFDSKKGVYPLYILKPDGSYDHKIAPTDSHSSGLPMGRKFQRPYLPFAWSTDPSLADHVAYLVDAKSSGGVHGTELRIAFADGSDNRRLSHSFDQWNQDPDDVRFAWAPDGSRIVYVTDGQKADRFELWSTDPRTTDPDRDSFQISKMVSDKSFDVAWYERDAFAWAPDASRVAFRGDLDRSGTLELWTADPTYEDPPNDKINSPLQSKGQNVETFRWSPDSRRIAYIDDENRAGTFELFCAGPTGSDRNVVSRIGDHSGGGVLYTTDRDDPALTGLDAPIQWSPDSLRLAYIADQNADGVFEAFAAMNDGSNNFRICHDLAPIDGDVCRVLWNGGGRLLYAADERTRGRIELLSAFPDGPTGIILTGKDLRGGTACPQFEVR